MGDSKGFSLYFLDAEVFGCSHCAPFGFNAIHFLEAGEVASSPVTEKASWVDICRKSDGCEP